MAYLKWTVIALLVLLVGGTLHYILPQHDVVRILEAYERRVDFSDSNRIFWAAPDSGAPVTENRDVRFIDAVYPDGKQMVYRNEDTNWGWPFYFKFDASDLNAEAKDLVSTKDAPQWVVIRHYGWRSNWLSIFPNATSVRAVDTPDVTIIPWFNIVFLTLFAGLILWVWRKWVNFRADRIEPLIDEVSAKIDEVDDRADAARDKASGVIGRFMDKLRGR